MKPFRPLAHYLVTHNQPARRRSPWYTPLNLTLAIIVIAVAVGWLPHWLAQYHPP